MGLGKIFGAIGSAVAAPFTGGASLAAIPSILGGAAEARAEGRNQENAAILSRDRNLLDRLALQQRGDVDRAGVDLQRRAFQERAPGQRLAQSRGADSILNALAAIQGAGDRQGFARGRIDPLQLLAPTESTSDLASLIQQRALEAQQAGDQFDPLPERDVELSELKRGGVLDSILSGGAFAGSLLGGIGRNRDIRTPPINPSAEQFRRNILENVRFGG